MSEVKAPTRPGEWLEHQVWLPAIMGLLTLGWIVLQFATKPVLTVMSSLNGYLFVFLMLGLVLHGTPARFLQAVTKAVPATAGILVQFPLYAAMAAIMTKAEGGDGHTLSHVLAEFFTAIGSGGGFAVIIAIYTALLGIAIVTLCDIIARTIIMPFEIPVSLVLGIVGSAIFVGMLLRQRRRTS